MRKRTMIGCSLAAIGLLVVLLTCSAGTLAVQRGNINPPRLNVRVGAYRVVTAPVTIRTRPPKRSYGVWLFVSASPQRGLLIETGQQVLLVPLSMD